MSYAVRDFQQVQSARSLEAVLRVTANLNPTWTLVSVLDLINRGDYRTVWHAPDAPQAPPTPGRGSWSEAMARRP